MIPIAAIAVLEYFLIECGATFWLQYLPSITWSTWPYVIPYPNFSNYISELLELVYLMPNAAPQIIYNYCTGVLWTIPVQLQGSWQILLGVVITREIKTPWKRFGFYIFCVLNNWYASSWGSYFWLGLMMTDLDATYKYRKWVLARPIIFWLLATTYLLLTLTSLSVDVANQTSDFSFVSLEHSIHPDIATGLPIYKTGQPIFPPYYVPRLNGIIFAISCQSLIELSPFIQRVFSSKILMWVFPHIFTIYLFHGLIFWSLGAMICVFLSMHGFTYWVNLLVTALCCYAALGVSLPIMTPIVEVLGKKVAVAIWDNAYNVPPLRRATLFPYEEDLFTSRQIGTVEGVAVGGGSSKKNSEKEKDGKKCEVREVSAFDV